MATIKPKDQHITIIREQRRTKVLGSIPKGIQMPRSSLTDTLN
uniref:Uncharacterized protein n=1 Tax=Arundo donax TaxID=35708 RepID=A0A0A9EFS1_ARUDO